ncbi:MAG: LPP20 family lipoprotein [Nitrospirales bacterium]|nr:LPP20 family lipoprotein [Nitrospirales bacterium]
MKRGLLIGLVSLISGCSLFGTQATPDWIRGDSRQFPPEQYLVGRGEADSRAVAERRAYAAIARVFRANITSRLQDRESYSQEERDDSTKTSRDLTLDHVTSVSSEKVLENVKVLQTWYQPDTKQYFALAGIHRGQAERRLLDRITELDRAIDLNITQARQAESPIIKLRGYKRALRDLRYRHEANTDLQVLRVSGEGFSPSYHLANIEQELQRFVLEDFFIVVKVSGDQARQVETAIWQGLQQQGLVTHEVEKGEASKQTIDSSATEQTPDILITGSSRLEDLALSDPLFTYVRWCSDLQILETQNQLVLGIVSRSGREGHITQEEARVRATRTMQKVVSAEIAESLARYIYSDEQVDASSSASCLPPR